MPGTLGELVSAARSAAGLTLRALGDRLGVSAPYLHDVEHGRRRLPPARWAALVEALPTLTVRQLAEAAIASGPVEIDARSLPPEQRAHMVQALENAAKAA